MITSEELVTSLRDHFSHRWHVTTGAGGVQMRHRSPASPSARRSCPDHHQVVSRLRDSLQTSGLTVGQGLLPMRWNRDTDVTISAVQALDPWLKDAQARVWREGFLPQPVVRHTGERDSHGALIDGYLTAFTNVSYVQRIDGFQEAFALLDHWFTALSRVGLHAGRLTVHGSLEPWRRPPVGGVTLFIDCDGRGLGDLVLLWNLEHPDFMAVDLGSGVERLRWYLSGRPWSWAAFGEPSRNHDIRLLDAIRAATLLLMAGIRATHRGPGHAVRALARTISPALARTGLSRLVRDQVAHWRAVGMTGPEWPIITAQLEETVLAMHQSNLRRRS
jgi:hypothetical protein